MPWMSLSDNVAYALPFRRPAAQIEKQVVHALDLVGLAGFGKAWPNQLSGGMAQRASLARAWSPLPRSCCSTSRWARWTACCAVKCKPNSSGSSSTRRSPRSW